MLTRWASFTEEQYSNSSTSRLVSQPYATHERQSSQQVWTEWTFTTQYTSETTHAESLPELCRPHVHGGRCQDRGRRSQDRKSYSHRILIPYLCCDGRKRKAYRDPRRRSRDS